MAQQAVRPLKVGLMLPFEETAPGEVARWDDLKQMALHAEAVGFDSVWGPDHLIFDSGMVSGQLDTPLWGIWEGWSILTALAAVTSRIEIGTLVACTSFRNPALIAKTAETIDEVSNGRFVLGLGAGYVEAEFRQFGYPFDHLVGRFEEALQIIHTLLRVGEIDHQGQYYDARNCVLRPRSRRRNGPPILIGAKRPRTLRLAAQYADSWNLSRASQPQDIIEASTGLDAACQKVGRDPAAVAKTALLLFDLPNAYQTSGGAAARAYRKAMRSITFSEPEEAAERLRAFARVGLSHVQLWLEPNTMASIDTFAPALAMLDRPPP